MKHKSTKAAKVFAEEEVLRKKGEERLDRIMERYRKEYEEREKRTAAQTDSSETESQQRDYYGGSDLVFDDGDGKTGTIQIDICTFWRTGKYGMCPKTWTTIMKLRTIGYYKEMPHGQETDPCIEEFINQEDPERAKMICNYLRNGSALIVSPGETIDVLCPEKGFSGTATAYTDGTWVWPGDLAYYVESYLLRIPDEFRQTMIHNNWQNPVAAVDFTKESIEINGIQMC